MYYRVLVVATYDSFLKAGVNVARRIVHSHIDIAIQYVKKRQLSMRQLSESGADKYQILDFRLLSDCDFSKYDIVVVSLGNIASIRLIDRLNMLDVRPLIISCFSGVIFGNTESISARIHSDILLTNNESDLVVAKNIAKEYNLDTKIINYGLVNIDTSLFDFRFRKNSKNLFFIDQVKIPTSKKDREYILDKLLDLARNNPSYCIFLKTRLYKNEITVHKESFSYSKLLNKNKDIPSNFFLFHDSIESAFPKMSACISFSSSVALEAIYYGIPTYIVKDLGISEKLYNPSFIESGLFIYLDELNEISEFSNYPNLEWFKLHISFDKDRDNILNNLIDNLIPLEKNRKTLPYLYRTTVKPKKLLYRKLRKLVISPKSFFQDAKLIRNFKKRKSN
ncbi:DUF6716 putative glycosyltransferase [Mannheimia haemolytica]